MREGEKMIKGFVLWYLHKKSDKCCKAYKLCTQCPFGDLHANCLVTKIDMALVKVDRMLKEKKLEKKNGRV